MIALGHIAVKDADGERRDKVTINGQIVNRSAYSEWGEVYSIYDDEYCEMLKNEVIADILYNKNSIEIYADTKIDSKLISPVMLLEYANTNMRFFDGECIILFTGKFNLEEWNKGYSIRDVANRLGEIVNSAEGIEFFVIDKETALGGFDINKKIESIDATLRQEELKLLDFINTCYMQVHNELIGAGKHAVTFEFEVDEHIKVACKQYLDYFVQFLKDLGIESQANTYDQVNGILFEVIPADQKTALKNIKECLMVYLSLIDDEEIETYEDHHNIAFMQLKANIGHLKSQMLLAQATIEQKQITIDLLKEVHNKNLAAQTGSGEMKFLNGVITVGQVGGKAFKVNLGRLLEILFRRG